MTMPGTTELLIILIVAGLPAAVVIFVVVALLRRGRSQKEMAAQLDRIERKLDDEAEE